MDDNDGATAALRECLRRISAVAAQQTAGMSRMAPSRTRRLPSRYPRGDGVVCPSICRLARPHLWPSIAREQLVRERVWACHRPGVTKGVTSSGPQWQHQPATALRLQPTKHCQCSGCGTADGRAAALGHIAELEFEEGGQECRMGCAEGWGWLWIAGCALGCQAVLIDELCCRPPYWTRAAAGRPVSGRHSMVKKGSTPSEGCRRRAIRSSSSSVAAQALSTESRSRVVSAGRSWLQRVVVPSGVVRHRRLSVWSSTCASVVGVRVGVHWELDPTLAFLPPPSTTIPQSNSLPKPTFDNNKTTQYGL
ncbi:hypothetical protein BJ912DRAFT_1047256 [Pholiota molesta]|nr:hypothetical protein BJ912DRAFT_1047256 [Pholiota molesta]